MRIDIISASFPIYNYNNMNLFKKITTYAISTVTTFSLGMLSLVGMMLIWPSIPFAIVSFFLAVAIEGTVFHQNIFEAMQRFGNQKYYLRLAIAKRELNKLKDLNKYQNNLFLADYFNQKKYLHELEENEDHYDSEFAEMEIERVKTRLEMMENLFIKCISNTHNKKNAVAQDIVSEINLMLNDCIDQTSLAEEVKNKNRYMNLGIGIAIGAGICSGLVALANMQSGFLVLGISIGLSSLAPIVGIAAVGYALLMYCTITDMIQNETLKKWASEFKQFWNKNNKNYTDYLKILGVVIVVSIALIATIATAGTWWYFAKAGASLINGMPKIAAAIISTLTWACMIVPTLLFNVVNAFKSIAKLPSIINDFCHGIYHDLASTFKSENILQFINPPRILLKIFKAAIFIGHLVSSAVASDRCPWFSPAVSTSFTSATEALVDLDYIAKDHPEKQANDDEDEDHHHGAFLLDKIEMMLNYLSILWDWGTSANSWKTAKNKFIEKRELPPAPPLSPQWSRYETDILLKRQVKSYTHKGVTNKAKAFSDLRQSLKTPAATKLPFANLLSQQINNAIPPKETPGKPLTVHRNRFRLFSKTPPKSVQILKSILSDHSLIPSPVITNAN